MNEKTEEKYVSKVDNKTIVVIGLGYVGFPLLELFSKHYKSIGFDINENKVDKLKNEHKNLIITSDEKIINKGDFVIIAVPTPVTKSKEPDLSYIKSASKIIGQNLKKDAIVVLESTVYPGVTEDIVGSIIEKESGLKLGREFKLGYSPERINPGDRTHTLDKTTKIVSGIDEETTEKLANLYGLITKVYKTKNIKVAEAAKVIENIQRDLNIALMNELSIIFNKMGLDTKSILDAASTKWNFYRYEPGLVGGHCIPVDPYYLVYKAKEIDYHPQVILAGRSVNDYMSKHVADITIRALNESGNIINGSKILIMGLTFKENVSDVRETPVKEMIKELKEFNCKIYGYDPLLNEEEIRKFDVTPLKNPYEIKVNCVIITVAHDAFKEIKIEDIKSIMDEKPVLIDVRGMLRCEAEKNGIVYRTL